MPVHRSFVDRQLLQRRVQMVAQRPLQLCQLPAGRELSVQRVAVARLITDDSMFLVLRQPIIPRGIPDVRVPRRVLVRDVLHLIRVQRNVGIRAAPPAAPVTLQNHAVIAVFAQRVGNGLFRTQRKLVFLLRPFLYHVVLCVECGIKAFRVIGRSARCIRVFLAPLQKEVLESGLRFCELRAILLVDLPRLVFQLRVCSGQLAKPCDQLRAVTHAQRVADVHVKLHLVLSADADVPSRSFQEDAERRFIVAGSRSLVPGVEHCERALRLVVHYQQIPVRVPHLTVTEVFLLRRRQLAPRTVPQRELFLYSPLILRASFRRSSDVAAR